MLTSTGLIWIVIFYVTSTNYPVPGIGAWNMVIGFGFIGVGSGSYRLLYSISLLSFYAAVDDVIYKGASRYLAIESYSKQKPILIHFLAFEKSSRFTY